MTIVVVVAAAGVTGNALPEDRARFIANGANEVVVKPLTKAKLLEAVLRYHFQEGEF